MNVGYLAPGGWPELDTTRCTIAQSRRFGRGSVWYPYLAGDEPMANLYFEDAEIGTSCTAGPYLVTKNEIIQFAKQYDPVPRHIDEEAAARSVFGGLTASSAHTLSIFILLTTRLQPRLHVLAGMGWDELRLPNAVRPGDELDGFIVTTGQVVKPPLHRQRIRGFQRIGHRIQDGQCLSQKFNPALIPSGRQRAGHLTL